MPEIRENSSITISAVNSRWSLISLVTALYFTRFSSTAAWVRAISPRNLMISGVA